MGNQNFTNVTILTPDGKENILDNIGPDARKDIEWVVIENIIYGFKFALHKKELMDGQNYFASKIAAKRDGGDCRLGNRFEWISIYNAIHSAGLNNILKEIGGDPIERKFYWIEELDEDPRSWKQDESGQSYATLAWSFSGTFGSLYTYVARISSNASRVIRAL